MYRGVCGGLEMMLLAMEDVERVYQSYSFSSKAVATESFGFAVFRLPGDGVSGHVAPSLVEEWSGFGVRRVDRLVLILPFVSEDGGVKSDPVDAK